LVSFSSSFRKRLRGPHSVCGVAFLALALLAEVLAPNEDHNCAL